MCIQFRYVSSAIFIRLSLCITSLSHVIVHIIACVLLLRFRSLSLDKCEPIVLERSCAMPCKFFLLPYSYNIKIKFYLLNVLLLGFEYLLFLQYCFVLLNYFVRENDCLGTFIKINLYYSLLLFIILHLKLLISIYFSYCIKILIKWLM